MLRGSIRALCFGFALSCLVACDGVSDARPVTAELDTALSVVESEASREATIAGEAEGEIEADLFTDVADAVGLDFVHFNGMSGRFALPEISGSGAALLDYDRDGDLDAYLVQGAALHPEDEPWFPPVGPLPTADRLFRNELQSAGQRGPLRFTDVTEASGIHATGYGMGVAVGDVDDDGTPDIYVTNHGPNQLWRNSSAGRFEEVSVEAGCADPGWSSSATFVDIDRDGDLDLYVANYVRFSDDVDCYATSSRLDYCGPLSFPAVSDTLYRNTGDGRFEDVTSRSLVGNRPRPGLGVVAADLDADGWPDLCVANDGAPNQLWLNQRDGTFRDDALLAGVALNAEGKPEASMGIDAGDFDGDGDDDLFMTHLMGESNTLYVNDGAGLFTDRSIPLGLASASLGSTAFGTHWVDHDNDGWLDLMAMNGAVRVLDDLVREGDRHPLDQRNQLFRNLGGERFEQLTDRAGPAFLLREVSRGAAFGDLDDDGRIDVLIMNNNGRSRLLRNTGAARHHWLGLRFVQSEGGLDVVGVRVAVSLPDGRTLWRRTRRDGSYCSSNDPRLVVGLGATPQAESVRAIWPDGLSEQWPSPAVDAYTTLVRGSGEPSR